MIDLVLRGVELLLDITDVWMSGQEPQDISAEAAETIARLKLKAVELANVRQRLADEWAATQDTE